jgi:DNA modification methylase
MNELKIITLPITDIKPFAKNAKLHPKEQVAQIVASIREYGFNDPIAISEDNEIIEGHGRLLAVKELGYTEVPCIRLSHLTEPQRRAYILAHNKLTMNSGFDTDLLLGELDFLKDNSADLSLTGFTLDELDKLFGNDEKEVKDDGFDLTAALEKAAFVMPGDVWTLDGKHRLICGDSTKADDISRLMGGKKANMCLTDIPFGVAYKSTSTGLSIANDNLKDDDFHKFLFAAFSNVAAALDNEGTVYVFHADSRGLVTRRAFDDAGLDCRGTCVWVKNALVLGHADYMYKHESILYGWKKGCKHKFFGDRTNSTVWEFDKPTKNKLHPNCKPLELLALPIKNSSQANGIVLDLFGGSGSTMISCQMVDRICYMSELDPKYASVILRRYAENFGGENIVCERNGEILKYSDLVKAVETK